MLGQGFAISAGACAALASVCAKLAVTSESTLTLCETTLNLATRQLPLVSSAIPGDTRLCATILQYVRLALFALVFVFNALMWTLFTKSLCGCSSSVEATVTNTASNFFFTAVLGWLLFGEMLALLWWAGASLIVIGLFIMHRAASSGQRAAKKAY